MPYRTIPQTNTKYALLSFDKSGNERTDDPDGVNGKFSQRILNDSKSNPATNVFFFSHGWQGDFDAAVDQYDRWIKAMVQLPSDSGKMGPDFRPLWIGLHWPSRIWGQETISGGGSFAPASGNLQDAKQQYLEEFGDTPQVRAALDVIFKEQAQNAAALAMPAHVKDAYFRLANEIGYTATGPGSAPEAEGAPFDPEKAFEAANDTDDFGGGGVLGALLSPLRTLTFWTMKFRARTIGEIGMHDFISQLQNTLPNACFHLMGHSFGCVVVSSILGGKDGKSLLPRPVESLALVQGALSLWAYADHVKTNDGDPGYFNAAFKRRAVSGPIVVTRSQKDLAVGIAYPAAVAFLVSDPSFDGVNELTPKSLPLWGGIGTFGIRSFQNLTDLKMLPATGDYQFKPGNIYNLVGDEFIASHTGVGGPEVAHAIWQAALSGAAPQNAASGSK